MSAAPEVLGRTEPRSLPVLWFDDGLYYAEIRHPASDLPIRVALHGISTLQQAYEALSALAGGLRSIPAAIPNY